MKKLISVGTLMLVVLMGVVMSGCGGSPLGRIERLTAIKLPKEMEIMYNQMGESGFGGLQSQYTIFQTKEEPTDFLVKYQFSAGNAASVKMKFDSYHNRIPETVPQEHHPDWTSAFLYKEFELVKSTGSTVSGLYFSDTMTLIYIVWGH